MINYSVCSALNVVDIQSFLYSRPQNMPVTNHPAAGGVEREPRMAKVGSGHGEPVPIPIEDKDNSKPKDVPDDDDDDDGGVEPYRKKELVMNMALKANCDGQLCTSKWDLPNSSSSN